MQRDPQKKGKIKNKILVVEDEFGLQETFREVFQEEGYDVRVAADGENGYKIYQMFQPDLILTDVVMPKISGIELSKKIRILNPKIKVIYVSGYFGLKNIKRELEEEIQKYSYPFLSKPFQISLMLKLVKEYLNKQ